MNITLSVDEDVVERAREVARHQGTSLNALIREYLERLAGKPGGAEIVGRLRELWKHASVRLPPDWRFNREEIYEERLAKIGGKRRGG